MDSDPQFTPQVPHCCVRIGITGHRPGSRLKWEQPALEQEIRGILQTVQRALLQQAKAASSRLGQPREATLHLVTALAEGADRCAARAARAERLNLEVILPFTAQDYARDFTTPDSKQEFQKLITTVGTPVLNMARPRDAGAGDAAAYLAAGLVMLDNCDILIAVWDRTFGDKRGGTEDIVAEASRRRMPVFLIDAQHEMPPTLDVGDGSPLPPADAAIARLIGGLLLPPGLAAFKTFIGEGKPGGIAYDGRNLGWHRLGGWLARFVRRITSPKARTAPDIAATAGPALTPSGGSLALGEQQKITDDIASRLGEVYRTSFTLLFLGSALAILAGLLAVFSFENPHLKAVTVSIELAILFGMLVLFRRGQNRAWHGRWVETRKAAEFLRVAAALHPVAATLPPNRDAEDDNAWALWYARACARAVPLPTAEFNTAYLAAAIRQFLNFTVIHQINYHRGNALRLKHLHHGLDRIGRILFIATLLAGGAYLAVYVYMYFRHGLSDHESWFFVWFKPLITFMSAGLPALVAALYGIRAQGDYEASAERSKETANGLLGVKTSLEQLSQAPDIDPMAVRAEFGKAGDIMLSDLNLWRHIYGYRPLNIG